MRLLIIGGMGGQIGAASAIARARGATVAHAETPAIGLETLRAGQGADLVMIDVRCDIKSFIEQILSERIMVPVVAYGISSDTQAAVRAIKAGAKEYIPLPPDAEMIAAVLSAVAEENNAVIFADPKMAQTLKIAEQVAPSDASVLICGESGVGKEVIARFIHNKSKRSNGKFVAINCAAIPENLLESELFGHEKGAFTGAVARRIGKFEEANGGTLLLDEISEMDLRLQSKLLRAIQERLIDRVGGNSPVKIDVRIIATSNRNMEEEVKKGSFREDLFFRLNVMPLKIPPLRERPQDIEKLALYFVKKYSESNGIEIKLLSAQAKRKLINHYWKGNVRELENTMHRAVLLASGNEIGEEAIMLTGTENHLQATPAANAASLVGRTVADVERGLILDTLYHCLGNRTHAANILGISIRTLRNKLKLYGDEGFEIPPPQGGDSDRAEA